MKTILVTGGAGYIGSHTLIQLIKEGLKPIVIDNLVNSSKEAIRRIEMITDCKVDFYEFDLRDKTRLDDIFAKHDIAAIIHFAGLKAVGESTQKPLMYYQNNIDSTLSLLEAMAKFKVNDFVFSSSATVYGAADVPYTETSTTGIGITNPYGRSKFMIEEILHDVSSSNPEYNFTVLRYFNPIGAHLSGLIGEDPLGVPNNLMPYIAQVASGKRDKLSVFGGDYSTPDGTCIRDYIHVEDLATGHVAALKTAQTGFNAYNLGTGTGTSVLELISAFEKASGKRIPYEIVERRSGDLPEFYANPKKAQQILKWKATRTVSDACTDTWNWQTKNPDGYT